MSPSKESKDILQKCIIRGKVLLICDQSWNISSHHPSPCAKSKEDTAILKW